MPSTPEPLPLSTEIGFPDLHHINAAIGWLELGAPADAAIELDKATFKTLAHPDVVTLRWKICARLGNWQLALYLGRTLVRIAPERPGSWMCLAFSLVNVQGAFDAWQELIEASRKYPRMSSVPAFLSRLCAQMTAHGNSGEWLRRWETIEREAARLKNDGVPPTPDKVTELVMAGGGSSPKAPDAAKPRVSF